MKASGFVLIALGLAALLYGGFSRGHQGTALDAGSLKAAATEQHDILISPIVGAIAIVGGLLLLALPRLRSE
jgi:hypothetical protein